MELVFSNREVLAPPTYLCTPSNIIYSLSVLCDVTATIGIVLKPFHFSCMVSFLLGSHFYFCPHHRASYFCTNSIHVLFSSYYGVCPLLVRNSPCAHYLPQRAN